MILDYLKLIVAILLVAISIISGSIPVLLQPPLRKICNPKNKITGISNSFAGGVFLAIALLHLLPEGTAVVDQELNCKVPIGYLIAVIGYLLILYIDKVAFDQHKLISHGKHHTDLGRHHHTPTDNETSDDEEENRVKHILSIKRRMASHIKSGKGEGKGYIECENLCRALSHPLLEYDENGEHFSYQLIENPHVKEKKERVPKFSTILLAVALSVHSLLEGLAIGLQENYGSFVHIVVAVLIHKIPESLALGISFGQNSKKLSLIILGIFSITSVVGILLGTLMLSFISPLVENILICLITGSFLYISASEIVVEEFSVSKNKHMKFFALLFGIGIIVIVITFIE